MKRVSQRYLVATVQTCPSKSRDEFAATAVAAVLTGPTAEGDEEREEVERSRRQPFHSFPSAPPHAPKSNDRAAVCASLRQCAQPERQS